MKQQHVDYQVVPNPKPHCLTKNLPLSSSQTHLHSKWFLTLQQAHLFVPVPLHNERKLLACVHRGRFFMRQVAALLSLWHIKLRRPRWQFCSFFEGDSAGQ